MSGNDIELKLIGMVKIWLSRAGGILRQRKCNVFCLRGRKHAGRVLEDLSNQVCREQEEVGAVDTV